MDNAKLLPFERNRFYVGKLLTSADFLAEQNYHSNKHRFINTVMFGPGVVCGLGVYNLDDQSVMIESGIALDGLGREIVLENSVVKRLSAIDGFETLLSDQASLCLRYREEAVHPVYSISARNPGQDEYDLNRIREGWELFLSDTELLDPDPVFSSEFLGTARMYEDADYAVDVAMPATVSCGGRVKLVVTVSKLSAAAKTFAMDCVLQTPTFTDASGEHELKIGITELLLEEGQTVTREFWMTAQRQPTDDSLIIAKTNFIRILIDGDEQRPSENFLLKVAVSQDGPDAIVEREIGKVSLETRNMSGAAEHIKIAELQIQRTKNAYIIDRIDERCKRYIKNMATEELSREYAAYFDGEKAEPAAASAQASPEEGGISSSYREINYATGVCEIPLASNMRRGEIAYSDEIMHGLGKGNVYVAVGVEYLSEDPRLSSTAKNTIYGDPELFRSEETPVPAAETAVKVMNDRGTFVVAAKLRRETTYVLLILRWVAIRMPMGGDQTLLQRMADKSIVAEQPTVVMATGESHFFNVRFRNMEPCTLTYELTEKDSGSITPDGIYTAPAKDGVYEIRISCADMPIISTYVYAVVKKKGVDDVESKS